MLPIGILSIYVHATLPSHRKGENEVLVFSPPRKIVAAHLDTSLKSKEGTFSMADLRSMYNLWLCYTTAAARLVGENLSARRFSTHFAGHGPRSSRLTPSEPQRLGTLGPRRQPAGRSLPLPPWLAGRQQQALRSPSHRSEALQATQRVLNQAKLGRKQGRKRSSSVSGLTNRWQERLGHQSQ